MELVEADRPPVDLIADGVQRLTAVKLPLAPTVLAMVLVDAMFRAQGLNDWVAQIAGAIDRPYDPAPVSLHSRSTDRASLAIQ
jgi:spore maturation protein SpmB